MEYGNDPLSNFATTLIFFMCWRFRAALPPALPTHTDSGNNRLLFLLGFILVTNHFESGVVRQHETLWNKLLLHVFSSVNADNHKGEHMTDFTSTALQFFFFNLPAVQNIWREHYVEESACSGFEEWEAREEKKCASQGLLEHFQAVIGQEAGFALQDVSLLEG